MLEDLGFDIIDVQYTEYSKSDLIIKNINDLLNQYYKNIKLIITHSMGALFLSKINNKNISDKKIILLNPFLKLNYTMILVHQLLNNSLLRNLSFYLPRWLIYNKKILTHKYNDEYNILIEIIKKPLEFANADLLKDVAFILYNENIIDNYILYQEIYNCNIDIIWAFDEELVTLDINTIIKLNKFFNLNIIIGKHESFGYEYDNIR